MKIHGSYLWMLRVDEQIGLLRQIVTILKGFDIKALGLEEQVVELENLIKRFEAASTVSSEREKSLAMEALDNDVDGFVTFFKSQVKSYAQNPKAELSAPGGLILHSLKEQGWNIEDMPYDAESAAIGKLNILFTMKPELVEAITKLNLKPFWDDVMAAEAKFLAMQGARTQAYGLKVKDSSTLVGRSLRASYQKLSRRIDAFAEVSDKPEYDKIIQLVNAVVEPKVQQLGARRTRNKKTKQRDDL